MAEVLGLTASVLAVATLAYSSSQKLYETLSDLHKAPEIVFHLRNDVATLSDTIHSLQQTLKETETDVALSEAQKSKLGELKPILDACHSACQDLREKIDRATRHSKDGTIKLYDRLKLQFQEKEIGAFQARLTSYKSTLSVALGSFTAKTTSDNLGAIKGLEAKIEDVMAPLTGQLQGLQIAMQAVEDSRTQLTEIQHSQILEAIQQQSLMLNQCYRVCMAAYEGTTGVTGHQYKYVKANQARLFIGDIGNVKGGAQHNFGHLEVEGGLVVAGNMDGASAKDFFR